MVSAQSGSKTLDSTDEPVWVVVCHDDSDASFASTKRRVDGSYQDIHVLQELHSVWEVLVSIKADKATVRYPGMTQREAIALPDDLVQVQDLPQPPPLNERNLHQHTSAEWAAHLVLVLSRESLLEAEQAKSCTCPSGK